MKKFFTLFLLLFTVLTFAQPGTMDTTFNPTDVGFGNGEGANSNVFTQVVQPDGKILIGGGFATYNGTIKSGIARLNADGSLDTSFNPSNGGANNSILSIAIQPDGKIVIGGQFTSFNGTALNHIARLNADGSLDTGFNSGTGANGPIESLAIQPDGKILIGGWFTTYNGIAQNRIARLNADGSLDTGFNSSSGVDGTILSLAIQTDGKILIGGYFTTYNNLTQNRIARLNADGSLDAGFNPGTGINPNDYNNMTIYSLAIQPDGKILIGGEFTTYNGTARNCIARLNANGSLDTGFNPGTGANSGIHSLAMQPNGKIVIGGSFTTYNDTARNRIARLNADGSLDTGFNPGTGADSTIPSLAIQPDGKILIGGLFTTYNGTACNRIARLNADGSLDTIFNPGTGANGTIQSLAIQPDGKILIGGYFNTYNGTARSRIGRLNANGSLDTGFNPGTGANNGINSLAIQPDGKILIGGNFTTYNGTTRNRIARLNADGSLDTGFNIGIGADTTIRTLALQADGKILIWGNFTTYNGTARNRIARLNADGSLDTGFNPGTGANNGINSLAIQPDEKILIGGDFTSYNGIGRNRIARVNGDIIEPTVPTLSASSTSNCGTVATTLSIATGTLNSATAWQWYSGSCGGTSLGSGTTLSVSPTETTTYFARGEGGGTALGSCGSVTITVTPNVTPTFTQVPAICSGGSLSALPTTSNNSITGTWSPSLDNTVTTEYTFTPAVEECASTATMTITVNPNVTPTFAQVAPICSGTTLSDLPTTSDNGITGTWSPALNNEATTEYTFTPENGQCATTATMTIVVNQCSQVFCSGARVSSLTPSGVGIKWYASETAVTPLSATALLTTKIYYYTETIGEVVSARIPEVVEINPTSIAGSVSGAYGTICYNSGKTLTLSATHRGNVQWQSAPLLPEGVPGTFSNSVGETGNTLNTGNLTATTYFRAVVTSGLCSSKNTAPVKVNVRLQSVSGTIAGGGATVCPGTNSTLLTLSGQVGSVQWYSSTNNIDFVSLAPYGKSASWRARNLTTTTYYRVEVTKGIGCTPAISQSVVVNVKPVTNAGIVSGTSTIPYNTRATLEVTGYDAGATLLWRYSRTATGVYYNGGQPIITNSTYTTAKLGIDFYFKVIVTKDGCPSSTAPFLIDVATGGKFSDTVAQSVEDNFDVIAYPNPSSSEFTIESSAKGAMSVKVYDMVGRLVENTDSTQVGSRLAAGVYNLIVTQDSKVKTLRVIKE